MSTRAPLTIDRIEDGIAVLEHPSGRTRTVPASALPEGAREGDRLIVDPKHPEGPFALAPRDDAALEAARAARAHLPEGPDGDLEL